MIQGATLFTIDVTLLSFLIGVICGLRSMTAPALVSWAAHLGWLHVDNTWLAFLGYAATPYILTVFAVGELIADKLPSTPSRKAPIGFGARILTGALSGAAVGSSLSGGEWTGGLIAGIVGAVAGTFGGYEFRSRLTKASGNAPAIAVLEDLIAIVGGYFIVR
jgi:uncharacterized membrane protein